MLVTINRAISIIAMVGSGFFLLSTANQIAGTW